MSIDSNIIAYLAERVKDKTIAESRVFEARFLPIQPEELPCITISPPQSNFTMDDGETHNTVDKQFTFVLYARGDEKDEIQSSNDPIFTKLDSMRQIIFDEFNNIYENLNKLVYRFKINNIKYELDPNGDFVTGKCYMTYSVTEHISVIDPKRL